MLPAEAAAEPRPVPATTATVPAGESAGAAKGWITRDLTASKAVDSVSITADGTVDLLRITQTHVGDVSTLWTATLYRQTPTGKLVRAKKLPGGSGAVPSLRTGEDGSSVLVVPSASHAPRASIWIRRNGTTSWRRTPAPTEAVGALVADIQRDGTLTIAYLASDGTVRTATRATGRGWTAARTVAAPGSGSADGIHVTVPYLDVSADGAATVVIHDILIPWDHTAPPVGQLRAASRRAGTTAFGKTTRLSARAVRNVVLAQAASKSVVAWETHPGSGRRAAYVRTRSSARASWSTPQRLGTYPANTYDSGLALAGSPDGRATIVRTDNAGTATVRVLSRDKDLTFSAPVARIPRTHSTRLAHARDGSATLVNIVGNTEATTGKLVVRTSNRAGTRWSAPRQLGVAVAGWDSMHELAVARSGAAAVVWRSKTAGARSYLVASHR